MLLRPISDYAQELKPLLPDNAFSPSRSHLLWLPVHLCIIVLAALAVTKVSWPWAALLSLVIGGSFACITFLAHDTLHGSVVRNRVVQHIVGWIGFVLFAVSPTLWVGWHNLTHHRNANVASVDPDMYPTLEEYQTSGLARFAVNHFALGNRRWRGVLSLLFGFSMHSVHMLITAQKRGMLTAREQRRAVLETLLGVAMWMSVAFLIGPRAFLFVFVVPLLLANVIVMAFILTNHGLNPLTTVNDPLINTLSVTLPGWLEWLTLRFGFHVEHHLFPSMSPRHAKQVRRLILERWPERYQSMPLTKALWSLHRTARVFKNNTTLFDPRTGREWPTLSPRTTEIQLETKPAALSASNSAAG